MLKLFSKHPETALEQQLARQEDWVNYWKNKYEKCLEELKKETTETEDGDRYYT